MLLRPADDADVPAVVSLMNRAYRGSKDQAAWNTEAGYIEGDRISEVLLRQDRAAKPAATLMVWPGGSGEIKGCVWLEPFEDGTWYLGSLTIDSGSQNAGLGHRLLATSEDWVRAQGGTQIRMTVVNVRQQLIAWYGRRGYEPTGETEPFPYDDARFGVPTRDDLQFVVLRKLL